jgi:hypothetical protein
MKNVKVLPVQQFFLEPIPGLTPGLPPLNGWTVQYVSGIEGATQTEPGHFLSKWQPNGDVIDFAFSPQPLLCYTDEDAAKSVCAAPRDGDRRQGYKVSRTSDCLGWSGFQPHLGRSPASLGSKKTELSASASVLFGRVLSALVLRGLIIHRCKNPAACGDVSLGARKLRDVRRALPGVTPGACNPLLP